MPQSANPTAWMPAIAFHGRDDRDAGSSSSQRIPTQPSTRPTPHDVTASPRREPKPSPVTPFWRPRPTNRSTTPRRNEMRRTASSLADRLTRDSVATHHAARSPSVRPAIPFTGRAAIPLRIFGARASPRTLGEAIRPPLTLCLTARSRAKTFRHARELPARRCSECLEQRRNLPMC